MNSIRFYVSSGGRSERLGGGNAISGRPIKISADCQVVMVI